MHWSRGYHALITRLIMHWSRLYQSLITWLPMHWSRGWSYTNHVTDHALITWLIMHWYRDWAWTDHMTIMLWSRDLMALIMWLIMRWSCLLSYTDHVPLNQRLANFSCKGADGRLPRLCPFCPRDSPLLLQCQSSHRQYVYKWFQLCSSKTAFIKIGCGLDLAHEL